MRIPRKGASRLQSGFTLIELLIVVAIIGVLASIAVPRYLDHVTKTEVSAALATIKSAQTQAELAILNGHDLSLVGSDDGFIGISATAGGEMGTVAVAQQGADQPAQIQFLFDGASASGNLLNTSIELSREENGWVCTTDVAEDYRPNACSSS